jgi:predicted MPP superfamily phosphohydrolase
LPTRLNFEFAIATANRLKPSFVVITGDLINQGRRSRPGRRTKRISAKLDPSIQLFSVPGNAMSEMNLRLLLAEHQTLVARPRLVPSWR